MDSTDIFKREKQLSEKKKIKINTYTVHNSAKVKTLYHLYYIARYSISKEYCSIIFISVQTVNLFKLFNIVYATKCTLVTTVGSSKN